MSAQHPTPEHERARLTGIEAGHSLRRQHVTPLTAAVAQTHLALPAGTPLGGYLEPGKRHSKTPGTLHLIALGLAAGNTRVVLLGIDAATVTPHLRDRTIEMMPEGVQVVTTATHCHAGPGGFGTSNAERLFLGSHDRTMTARLARTWASCAARALDRLQPVQVVSGDIEAARLVINRTEPGAPVDPTVDVVLVRAKGGAPMARLVSFAAHPTLTKARDILGGDYPAAMRASLSTLGSKVPTLFSAGASGSAGATRPPDGDPTAFLGRELAEAILSAEPGFEATAGPGLACLRIELDMPKAAVPGGAFGALRETLSHHELPDRLPIDLVRLGATVIAVLPGELSAEATLPLRTRFTARGLDLVLMSHNGSYGGYFMPASRHGEPGPESYLEVYGPGAAQLFDDFLSSVAEGLAPSTDAS